MVTMSILKKLHMKGKKEEKVGQKVEGKIEDSEKKSGKAAFLKKDESKKEKPNEKDW